MKDLRATFLGLGLLLFAAGCTEAPAEPQQNDLAAARARWEASGIEAYTYGYRMLCFCPPQLQEQALVSVSAGTVTSVYLVDSARQAAPETLGLYDTIEGLFDRLEGSLARDPVLFAVEYQPELGYPVSAAVDISTQIADEEYDFEVSTLVAVRP